MATIDTEDPIAQAVTTSIQSGEMDQLRELLRDNPGLATARLGDDDPEGMSRTLLHVATDWPGNFPNVAEIIGILVEAGADPDARFRGPHAETPLHWAASSDDLAALDALLDLGADIEAPGAVIAGGTPMADATAFGNWAVARRLLERGARTNLFEAAALGLADEVERHLAENRPTPETITSCLWGACHGGQVATAAILVDYGADLDWIGYDDLTPLDAARRSGAADVIAWLEQRGARSAGQIS